MTGFESLSTNQKVRATLHRDIRTISSETCHFLGLEVTKPAMEVIAELVYAKLQCYAEDLEAFSHHAKRNTINTDDVKLLVRRNPSLKKHLNTITVNQPGSKEKRKKTNATVAKQPDTANQNQALKENNKSIEEKKDGETDKVESMVVDNTIDLTFE